MNDTIISLLDLLIELSRDLAFNCGLLLVRERRSEGLGGGVCFVNFVPEGLLDLLGNPLADI